MKSITISKKKYENLTRLAIPNEVRNTEARIFEYDHQGKTKILKDLYLSSGEMFGSKLFTVEALDYYKDYLPESFVIPDTLATVSGKVIGFTLPKVEGVNLEIVLNDSKISLEEKKYYLKKIGELLEQLKNIREYTPLKDIFINDLQESNFIINPNNRSLKTIDLDSCKITSNSAFPARYLSDRSLIGKVDFPKYVKNTYPKLNEGDYIANAESDMYCYSMIILNFLFGHNISRIKVEDFYTYLSYLSDIGIHKELLDCFEQLLRYDPNTNPVHFIDSLTYTHVGRAREAVYKLNKRR